MNSIKWNISREEAAAINAIATRAAKSGIIWMSQRGLIEMSLIACHLNGVPLDLQKLMDAERGTLAHDIFGIDKNVCRATGKLLNQFLPRCAKKES